MTTFEYRLRCMNCSLHYAVYSWEQWADKHDRGGFCPECGIRGGKMVFLPIEREEQIFQLVPGDAVLAEITVEEQVSPFGVGGAKPPRGPYGTNEGDLWLAPGSEIQNRLDADGDGMLLVHTLQTTEDGTLEEAVFTTNDPYLVRRARLGHEQWVAAQAKRN